MDTIQLGFKLVLTLKTAHFTKFSTFLSLLKMYLYFPMSEPYQYKMDF